MNEWKSTRKPLAAVLSWNQAHASFEEAVKGLPYGLCHIKPHGLPHSIWDLVVHCRIAQWDILQYSKDTNHQSPKWPEEYWPDMDIIPSEENWNNALKMYFQELEEIRALIENPETDLLKPFPNGSGHTFLREVLILADHTSYHTGQIILIRRLLNIW